MKKVFSFMLIISMCTTIIFSLSACGTTNAESNKEDNEEDIVLTDEMIETANNKLNLFLKNLMLMDANRAAKARIGTSEVWNEKIVFDDYTVGSTEQINGNQFCTYGKLFGETAYGDSVSCNFEVTTTIKVDPEAEDGFSVYNSLAFSASLKKDN